MQTIWQTFLARRSDLWVALGQHLQISLIALIIAVVIAVPLAIWVQPHKRIANVLLQVTGVLQTIPSLALLGLLIPFVGIGNVPAIIALVVYALLPIFQNTYVGLADIDPAYREAERAFGIPRYLQLLRVELPLALPVIIGGIRTATVMIIGTATLAALIGAGGLGTFILLGINRNDPALTLIGAIASAALALVFSAGLAVVQRLKWRQLGWLAAILVVLGGGAAGYHAWQQPKEEIVVAGKLGSEPEILINMYKQLIEQADPNVTVTLKPNFGQTSFLFSALKSGKVDLYPEFTGTVVTALAKPSPAQQRQIDAGADSYPIAKALLAKSGLTMLKPMQYNNTYALVVKQSFGKAHGLTTISDLTKLGRSRAGFDLEFNDRADGYKGLKQAYGLNLAVSTLDASLRYQAIVKGQVVVTDGYSTDAQLRQYHLVALRDDKRVFATYRGAPVMKVKFAKAHPRLVRALNRLAGRISEEQMQEMNYEVGVKQESAAKVAKAYLQRHGLLEARHE